MSADNWDICPRCLDKALSGRAEQFQIAAEAYGHVPAEDYEALRAAAQEPFDEETYRTFREDYEFYGAKDGTIEVVYSGGCSRCGLTVSFRHSHSFYERTEGRNDAEILGGDR